MQSAHVAWSIAANPTGCATKQLPSTRDWRARARQHELYHHNPVAQKHINVYVEDVNRTKLVYLRKKQFS